MSNNNASNRDTARVVADPPAFTPPPEMRSRYLEQRKSELEMMLDSARSGVWKPVFNIVNHVRGTGAMYGFDNIGLAAEDLVKAVQNGDVKSLDYMEAYARIVSASYV